LLISSSPQERMRKRKLSEQRLQLGGDSHREKKKRPLSTRKRLGGRRTAREEADKPCGTTPKSREKNKATKEQDMLRKKICLPSEKKHKVKRWTVGGGKGRSLLIGEHAGKEKSVYFFGCMRRCGGTLNFSRKKGKKNQLK